MAEQKNESVSKLIGSLNSAHRTSTLEQLKLNSGQSPSRMINLMYENLDIFFSKSDYNIINKLTQGIRKKYQGAANSKYQCYLGIPQIFNEIEKIYNQKSGKTLRAFMFKNKQLFKEKKSARLSLLLDYCLKTTKLILFIEASLSDKKYEKVFSLLAANMNFFVDPFLFPNSSKETKNDLIELGVNAIDIILAPNTSFQELLKGRANLAKNMGRSRWKALVDYQLAKMPTLTAYQAKKYIDLLASKIDVLIPMGKWLKATKNPSERKLLLNSAVNDINQMFKKTSLAEVMRLASKYAIRKDQGRLTALTHYCIDMALSNTKTKSHEQRSSEGRFTFSGKPT